MATITAPFGIKGWVRIATFTESAGNLGSYKQWFVSSPTGWETVELEDFAVHAKSVVAKLKGCDDRNAAELMRKRKIAIPREWLEPEADGEHYWVDLIGSAVVTRDGTPLGTVAALMETGANDVLVVRQAGREWLIPFVQAYVVAVDREAHRITVDWRLEWDNPD